MTIPMIAPIMMMSDVNRAFRKGKVAPVIVSGSACGYGISRLR